MTTSPSSVRRLSTGLIAGLLAWACTPPATAAGQQRITLERALSLALARGPSLALSLADSAASAARLDQARAFPNPTVTAQYTEATPQHHVELEQPLPFPWTRSSRVSAAAAGRTGAALRLALDRATLLHDVEVAYVVAAAAERRSGLSARTSADAEELVRIVLRREQEGDAAALEVAIARMAAGEAIEQAATDSLEALTSLLALQRLIGEPVDRVSIALADSLESPRAAPGPGDPVPPNTDSTEATLPVSVARADLQAADAALTLARRSRLPEPSLLAGFERHDPSGGEPGTLPLVGLVVSIPLFNRGVGEVGQARAEVERARGALELARRESTAAVATAILRRAAARARAERSRALLDEAERVATLSNRAYEEGAFALTTALEAQRSARDARLRHVEDLAAVRIAEADYELAIRTRRDR